MCVDAHIIKKKNARTKKIQKIHAVESTLFRKNPRRWMNADISKKFCCNGNLRLIRQYITEPNRDYFLLSSFEVIKLVERGYTSTKIWLIAKIFWKFYELTETSTSLHY